MMGKKTKLSLLILSFLVFSTTFLNQVKAVAISPDMTYINVNSTQAISNKLTIFGKTTYLNSFTAYLYPIGIRKVGEANQFEFYIPSPDKPGDAANWIKLEKNQVQIVPGQDFEINWHSEIKSGAVPCGTSFAGILVSDTPIQEYYNDQTAKESKVDIRSRIVSQVYFNVNSGKDFACLGASEFTNGNLTILKMLDFYPEDGLCLLGTCIYDHQNVKFTTRVQNLNSFIVKDPQGFIEISGLGGRANTPFNRENLDFFPNSTRKISDYWVDENYPEQGDFFTQLSYQLSHLRIGHYQADLGITKNVTTQLTASTGFWILPWRLILIIAIIIGAVIGYKKWQKRSKNSTKTAE